MALNFRNSRRREEPEINLIPFIDVLLVVLIFLMLSTTYSKFTELQITLPVANADAGRDRPHEIVVAVAADGRFAVNRKLVDGRSVDRLTVELVTAAGLVGGAGSAGGAGATGRNSEQVVIVSADASTPHQSVVTVMDAARRAGLTRLIFASQTATSSAAAADGVAR